MRTSSLHAAERVSTSVALVFAILSECFLLFGSFVEVGVGKNSDNFDLTRDDYEMIIIKKLLDDYVYGKR